MRALCNSEKYRQIKGDSGVGKGQMLQIDCAATCDKRGYCCIHSKLVL